MPRKKKDVDLVMKVDGNPTPFARVQFAQNLPVEFDQNLDLYKGEIKVWPAPIALHASELHPDGTLKFKYGTEIDFVFGPDATIRGKVLNMRGKLRIIEVGMMVGDILYEKAPTVKGKPDVEAEEVESFAASLPQVQEVV